MSDRHVDPLVDAESPDRWSARCEDGSTVTVFVVPSMVETLRRHLPPFGLEPVAALASPATREFAAPARDDGPPANGLDVDGFAWNRLESDLGLFTSAHLVGRVAIHAGVVIANGRCLLLPGRSHVGKSTLCRALSDAGAVLMSDEYAIVDVDTGEVSGWPRPVRIRRDDGTIDRLELCDPEAPPVMVSMVAALHYEPGAEIAPVAMSGTEIAMELVANTVSAQLQPDWAFAAAVTIGSTATGLRSARGEADVAAADLVARLA